MIQLKKVVKTYVNKKDKSKNVEALKDISITFPQQGFVSILGPSGCGKTTLLNILGGLDTKYRGEFIVNGISTKQFKPKDWDAYRNNHVGFVFQEYNLIPHQNVSKNVELVLTIAGAQKLEVKEKSKKVLSDVGLEYKIGDAPNKLSGGQKQRVAIARALVNDPELILADEPTSALDSRTSEQVMDILKEISKKKLVIMVTHNVDLAKKYSSKIINILDGRITEVEDIEKEEEKEEFLNQLPQRYKYGKSKMKLKTAFALSFKNLMTKKRRTILTVLAGSIGIICLTVIMGIINGANSYAKDTYNNLFTRPLHIQKKVRDTGDMYSSDAYKRTVRVMREEEQKSKNSTKVQTSSSVQEKIQKGIGQGKEAKEHTNNLNDGFKNYMLDLLKVAPQRIRGIYVDRLKSLNFMFKSDGRYVMDNAHMFGELPYSNSLDENFELVGDKSRWPTKKDEVLVCLNSMNVLDERLADILGVKGKKDFDVSELIGKEIGGFVPHNLAYKQEGGMFAKIPSTDLQNIYTNPGVVKLKIVGALKTKYKTDSENVSDSNFMFNRRELLPVSNNVLYTHELGDYVYKTTAESDIVAAQKLSKKSVLLDNVSGDNMRFKYFAFMDDKKDMKKDITELLADIGFAENSNEMQIYMNSPVDDEEYVKEYIQKYNEGKQPEDQVMLEKKLFGYKETAQNIKRISYFLLATIGLASLLSSLIMIALLEFISVLERIREIGVLRSVGARKKDISRLFKSEAVIVGFFTGIAGVFVGFLCSIGLNHWVRTVQGLPDSSQLVKVDILTILGLTLFSVLVTLLAGLIPAKIASRKDPVRILTGTNN